MYQKLYSYTSYNMDKLQLIWWSTVIYCILYCSITVYALWTSWKVFPTSVWICPSTLRKWEFIFSDATRQNMADLTPQCEWWIWQVSYCPRPSRPLSILWETSAVYTYLFHLFPPKQLVSRPRGNLSCETAAHIPANAASCRTLPSIDRINVGKHFSINTIYMYWLNN